MGSRKIWTGISIGSAVLSIISLFIWQLNFGIDFVGGTLLEVQFKQEVALQPIRETLAKAGYHKYVVKHYGSNRDVHIYIGPIDKKSAQKDSVASATATSAEKNAAAAKFELNRLLKLIGTAVKQEPVLRKNDFVGSQVGDELVEDGGLALLVTFFCVLLYVALRYEFRFAAGAIIALVHDILFTLGLFSLFGIEFDLAVLAALLAVIGYSLNDTIVVFDRIRENFRKVRKGSVEEVMNISLNETLSRTLMTSVATLLVVIALLILGGDTLFGFSIALCIGIVVGTYSSIYVASAAALAFGVTRANLMVAKKEDPEIDARP